MSVRGCVIEREAHSRCMTDDIMMNPQAIRVSTGGAGSRATKTRTTSRLLRGHKQACDGCDSPSTCHISFFMPNGKDLSNLNPPPKKNPPVSSNPGTRYAIPSNVVGTPCTQNLQISRFTIAACCGLLLWTRGLL